MRSRIGLSMEPWSQVRSFDLLIAGDGCLIGRSPARPLASFFAAGYQQLEWMETALLDTASGLASFPPRSSRERLYGRYAIRQDMHRTSQPIAIFDAL